MKNISIRFTPQRLFLFVISLFALNLTTTYAQIGPSPQATNTPNYGIYGSAPTPSGTPFTCGEPRYARLTNYPEFEGDTFSQTLPLNGLTNFNFYYTADGNGFLSGGGYRVTYLNSSQTNCYGSGDIVSYSPNRAHTNGIQTRPFSGSLTTPRGIHGIVKVKIPGGGGAEAFLENAVAVVYDSTPAVGYRARTNGVGYYSVYYNSLSPNDFIPQDNGYGLNISGLYNGCPYTHDRNPWVIWFPWQTPGPNYYVSNSEWDDGTVVLTSTAPGCQP